MIHYSNKELCLTGDHSNLTKKIIKYTNTKVLTINDNLFKKLKGIHKFTNLRRFIVKNNQLKKLTKNIWKLKNLRTLDLSNNQLTKLPQSLDQSNLEIMDLNGNQLIGLPEMYSFNGFIDLTGNKFVKFIAEEKGHFNISYNLINPNQVCVGGSNSRLMPISKYINKRNIQNYVNACKIVGVFCRKGFYNFIRTCWSNLVYVGCNKIKDYRTKLV